jgi:hypothetical protein
VYVPCFPDSALQLLTVTTLKLFSVALEPSRKNNKYEETTMGTSLPLVSGTSLTSFSSHWAQTYTLPQVTHGHHTSIHILIQASVTITLLNKEPGLSLDIYMSSFHLKLLL